ncbi:MAG: hypothetical protein AB8B67_04345 [Rickettsiaceae bacterium]
MRFLEKELPWDKIKHLVADKGYDISNARKIIKSYDVTPAIPFKGIYASKAFLSFIALAIAKCYNIVIVKLIILSGNIFFQAVVCCLLQKKFQEESENASLEVNEMFHFGKDYAITFDK